MDPHALMPHVETWGSDAFVADVADWVTAASREAGVALTGEREQPHVRPWSSTIRFGAEGGAVWFKVNARGTRHEGTLVAALAGLEPDLVPEVVAVDAERGWYLSRHGGPVMREIAPPDDLWDSWQAVLVRYAEAQLRLAEQAGTLLATGLPEWSPTTLPARFRGLVDELAARPPGDGGLTEAEQEKLLTMSDDYTAWCEELATSGLPSSLQHDDLHSSNICWGGSAGSARIIDWGDASWGFPLTTMLCTLNSMAWHAGCELDDPRVVRMRDAYLEPFTEVADRDALVRYVDLARRTGCVTRAMSYRLSFLDEPLETHREHDFPVRGWLLELLER